MTGARTARHWGSGERADRVDDWKVARAIDGAAGREELRLALRPWLLSGRALWLWAEGLSVGAPGAQARMLRMLAPFHRGIARGGRQLEVLVVDWSTTVMPWAEQLAMLSVLAEAFRHIGTHIIGCSPVDPSSALVFTGEAGAACRRWVHGGPLERRYGRWQPTSVPLLPAPYRVPLAPAVMVSPSDRAPVGAFLDALGASVLSVGASDAEAYLAQGVAIELVQNILRHATGAPAGIAATLRSDSIPVVEIGAADAGPGVARNIAGRLGLDLSRIPERHFLTGVFKGTVTGEVERSRERDGGGRGFARMARMVVHEAGGRVTVRSGGARLLITGGGDQQDVVSALSHGFGTQVLVEIPLTGRFDTDRES